MSGHHKLFTVDGTAYMRSLSREDINERWLAIHYQSAPQKTERGTSFGMRFPVLIVAQYVDEPREIADKVASILNAHWDTPDGLTLAQSILADCTDTTPVEWIEMASGIVGKAEGHD